MASHLELEEIMGNILVQEFMKETAIIFRSVL